MSLFELGRRILNKKIDAHIESSVEAPELDIGLPLNARIGGLIELPAAAFALLGNSLVQVPKEAQMQIAAISRLRLDADDIRLYRYYTSVGENRQGKGEGFLQVLATPDGIQELAYYQFLERQIPTTAEEQEPFLGLGYGLGDRDYFMGYDQLEASGLNADQIGKFLPTVEDVLHYVRDTPGPAYVPPFEAQETRIDDKHGEKGLTQKVWFMPYVRELPDIGLGRQLERLLISFEVVESVDGDKRDLLHVDFMVGITLDINKVNIY